MFNNQSLIILIIICGTAVSDFYLPGSRYYNTEKCYDLGDYLNHFEFTNDPRKNQDKMVKMTLYMKETNTKTNCAAYISADDKQGLSDAHDFFKLSNEMKKEERVFFANKVDCVKDVKFFLFGFGSYDSYGLAYQLNPTIHQYVLESVKGSAPLNLLDIFDVFLDIFRGYEVIIKNNYYILDLGYDDIGINLYKQKDGTVDMQGRFRRLHNFRKGNKDDHCQYKSMSNFNKNLASYIASTGKKYPHLQGVNTCQNLNLAAILDVFEDVASSAIDYYHKDESKNFDYCFAKNVHNTNNCPESLKPIWGDNDNKYVYRMIRGSIIKWSTETVIDHLVRLFDLLKEKEIARLARNEKVRIIKMKLEAHFSERIKKQKQKMLLELLKNGLQKEISKKENASLKSMEEPNLSVLSNIEEKQETVNNTLNLNSKWDKLREKHRNGELAKMSMENEVSESGSEFLRNGFNIENSEENLDDESISQKVYDAEQELNHKKAKEKKVINEFLQVLQKKVAKNKELNGELDTNEDIDLDKTGQVKKAEKKIIETEEIALNDQRNKDIMLENFKKNVQKEIAVIKNDDLKNDEVEKLDTIADIMTIKDKIDTLKLGTQNSINKAALDDNIAKIGKKLDLAIKKYGSAMEVVNGTQVTITLGGLKRDLQPYYLKKNVENQGKLKISGNSDDFIFL